MKTQFDREWEQVKKSLMNGMDPKKADILDEMLENSRRCMVKKKVNWLWPVKHIMWRMKYLVGVDMISPFKKVVLPIIRRVMPKLMAQELVGVQPMPGPVAQVMKLKATYDPTYGMNIHERWRYEMIKVIMAVVKRAKLLWALRYSKRYMFRQYRQMMKSGI